MQSSPNDLQKPPISHPSGGEGRLLTFASGGWVILVAALLGVALFVWAVAPAVMRSVNRPPGDGKHIESYGFDLDPLLVPRQYVVPAMLHRDMAPPLTNPTSHTADKTQRINDPKYGKYLVSGDRVIGVEVNGEARAYPLRVMYVHEIVNDTLGSPPLPIAVTHHWPSGATAVFDRRVNGQTLEFGVSGLVYNSNLLMYDRAGAPGVSGQASGGGQRRPSLWSQLQARAVSGAAAEAGLTLKPLPAAIVTWGQWLQRHPNTTVVDRKLSMTERYKDAAPTTYMQSDSLIFAVDPMPPADGPSAKTPVLVVTAGERRRVYNVSQLIRRAHEIDDAGIEAHQGVWTDSFDSITLRFLCNRTAQTVWVESANGTEPQSVVYAYWFAWHAMHPDDRLVQ
jgi:hypothetical protein